MHKRRSKPDEDAHGDDEVGPRWTIQLLGEGPSDGVGVECLYRLPTPDIIPSRFE